MLTATNRCIPACGSLALKLKRGGGCMDHQFHKPAQPWEKSEGCVHLLAELSQLKQCQGRVCSLLPLLADSRRHKHYSLHYSYLDTVMKQTSESSVLKVTSTDCLQQLLDFIGRAILKGRVEQYNPSTWIFSD